MSKPLEIDEEGLQSAKTSMSPSKKRSVKQSLEPKLQFATRNGIPLLPKRGKGHVITMELVNKLRDEIPE